MTHPETSGSFLVCALCRREGLQQYVTWGTTVVCSSPDACRDRQRKNGIVVSYHPYANFNPVGVKPVRVRLS